MHPEMKVVEQVQQQMMRLGFIPFTIQATGQAQVVILIQPLQQQLPLPSEQSIGYLLQL